MQVHKQDDGDREGMRIASEANRRYILTPALAGGGIRGGRGDGASNGSIASVATTEAGGGYGGSTAAGKICVFRWRGGERGQRKGVGGGTPELL